jgi:hypothetical protein
LYNGLGACFAQFNAPAAADTHIDAFSVKGFAADLYAAFVTRMDYHSTGHYTAEGQSTTIVIYLLLNRGVVCYAGGMSDDVAKELRYVGAQMEQVLSEVKAVHELVAAQPTLTDFHRLEDDIAELKGDVKTIKAAVKATNHDLEQHKSMPAHVAHGRAR